MQILSSDFIPETTVLDRGTVQHISYHEEGHGHYLTITFICIGGKQRRKVYKFINTIPFAEFRILKRF